MMKYNKSLLQFIKNPRESEFVSAAGQGELNNNGVGVFLFPGAPAQPAKAICLIRERRQLL
jgi:hypothetical protein